MNWLKKTHTVMIWSNINNKWNSETTAQLRKGSQSSKYSIPAQCNCAEIDMETCSSIIPNNLYEINLVLVPLSKVQHLKFPITTDKDLKMQRLPSYLPHATAKPPRTVWSCWLKHVTPLLSSFCTTCACMYICMY